MRPLGHRGIAALLLGSGLAALLYQTAWQRMLSLVFGATTAASAAVLAIFLGGLGVGGAWLGSRAERHSRPLMYYGNLEVGVALSAAITPWMVDGIAQVYWWLGGSVALGSWGATSLRLILTTVVLGPTVVLMGGTLPAAARAAESESDTARGRLALLYAVNTAGAVLGSLLGTFLLFEVFGTRLALWTGVLLNLLIAVLARAAARNTAPLATNGQRTQPSRASNSEIAPEVDRVEAGVTDVAAPEHAPESLPNTSDSPALPQEHPPRKLIYVCAALVGAAFLSLELVWYRMLAPILGGTTFTFGLILAVALAGIGFGGYLYSRRPSTAPATLNLLAMTVALEACLMVLPMAIGDDLAIFTAYARGMTAFGFFHAVIMWSSVAALVVFGAAVVSGYQFPVIIGLLGHGRSGIAREVGLAYAFNTGGSIVGALVGGFLLIPTIGAVNTWRLVALTLALLALLLLAVGWRSLLLRPARPLATGLVVLCTLLCSVAEGPSAAWRHSAIGAGRAVLPNVNRNALRSWLVDKRKSVAWEKDGLETMVGMEVSESMGFLINGKSDGNVWFDRATQIMAPVLPAMLHPNPNDVFIVGLGTGMSAGWAASLDDVSHVTVAELEPAILKIADEAKLVNHDVLHRSDVDIFLGDAREYLLTTDKKFDLIFSEPSNPYRSGIANLFTQEMYQCAKDRLKPGGWYLQWLQGYETDVQTLRIVLKTLRGVFEHVEIWNTVFNDLLLVATPEPLVVDIPRLRTKLAKRSYRDATRRALYLDSVEGILGRHLVSSRVTEALAGVEATPTNTDDLNHLEYAFAKNLGSSSSQLSKALSSLGAESAAGRPTLSEPIDWNRVDALSYRDTLDSDLTGFPRLPPEIRERASQFLRACHFGGGGSLEDWGALLEGEPVDFIELALRTVVRGSLGDGTFREDAAKLRAEGFVAEADYAEASFDLAGRRPKVALQKLLHALSSLRLQGLPLCRTPYWVLAQLRKLALANPVFQKQILDSLLQGPLAANLAENERRRVAQQIASLIVEEPNACIRALGAELKHPWWNRDFLELRLGCLRRAKHPWLPHAEADMVLFLEATPGNIHHGLGD